MRFGVVQRFRNTDHASDIGERGPLWSVSRMLGYDCALDVLRPAPLRPVSVRSLINPRECDVYVYLKGYCSPLTDRSHPLSSSLHGRLLSRAPPQVKVRVVPLTVICAFTSAPTVPSLATEYVSVSVSCTPFIEPAASILRKSALGLSAVTV